MKKILFAAAHSGFNLGEVPLGGGASVCQHLVEEWARTKPFEWELLGPSLLGAEAPRHKDLVSYSEMDYAHFCGRFEKKLTETIQRHDPKTTVVLCNDVSEGPDFSTLAAQGYCLYTIYHVDVVDYFSRIYLRGWIKPESAARFYRWLGPFRPIKMLDLVFQKQQDSVQHSKGLIVPSKRMKEVLLREYPGIDAEKIHVLPWGAWDDPADPEEVIKEKETLQKTFSPNPGSWTLLMLSRISPEKGQDRLLKALALLERDGRLPAEGIQLFLAGEAAYMMGKRYEKELRRLTAKLKRCRVHFVGYAAGARKKALFELADLYIFPSRHESYGLTLLEALSAGLPVLTTPSHGAQEVFQPSFGKMIPPSRQSDVPSLLAKALKELFSSRAQLNEMGSQAKAWASRQNFSKTAAQLAQLLMEN